MPARHQAPPLQITNDSEIPGSPADPLGSAGTFALPTHCHWFKPLEENNQSTNAPVSYPFLWGTWRENFVQWNAIAPNTLKYERLERNIVEALGVFGRINLTQATTLSPGYRSTVNATNQWQLEESLVHVLKSPQWPEAILGAIDPVKANRGKAHFQQYCASCHALSDRNSTAPIIVKPIKVADVGTDPAMTTIGLALACHSHGQPFPNLVREGWPTTRLESSDLLPRTTA